VSGEAGQGPAGASVERTCLACRSVLPKAKLLRVAIIGGHLGADINNRAGGRGAYICLKKECLSAVCKKKGAFSRALRVNVSRQDVEALFGEITDILDARLDSGIMDDN